MAVTEQTPFQTRVENSFRRGLATYHGAARAQAASAAQLIDCLTQVVSAPRLFPRVFEFGCGTGHLTEAFLAQYRVTNMWLNDLVADAETIVRAKVSETQVNLQFQAGPVETVFIPKDLDLILSGSTLQWVEDIPGLLNHLADHLAPGGLLVLSTFGEQQFTQLRALGSKSFAPSYTNADQLKHVLPASMVMRRIEQSPHDLYFPTTRDILRHLRDTGVNGRAQTPWSRRKLATFDQTYKTRFACQSGLPLTYDPVFMVAEKI